jgi:hypothetical protein
VCAGLAVVLLEEITSEEVTALGVALLLALIGEEAGRGEEEGGGEEEVVGAHLGAREDLVYFEGSGGAAVSAARSSCAETARRRSKFRGWTVKKCEGA